MDQAIDSGNFINFGKDQKLATDFSANYKTKKFKDFYQEESSYVPVFKREKEETSEEETTEYIPLFNRQGFDKDTEKSFTSAFKFRGGSKVYDAGSEILYNLLNYQKNFMIKQSKLLRILKLTFRNLLMEKVKKSSTRYTCRRSSFQYINILEVSLKRI